ncbi:MAG: hypothetical protein RLZ98_981 [Pseudomonadota bacterium]|jgi:hypothetical protein
MTRISVSGALSGFVILAMAVWSVLPASAHHGWEWTTGKNVEMTGVIKQTRLGNPHGVLEVEVSGAVWTFEVGQPWRNKRAGLKNGDLAPGVSIRVSGEPAADKSRRLKVERLWIGKRRYDLYPDRK